MLVKVLNALLLLVPPLSEVYCLLGVALLKISKELHQGSIPHNE